MMTEGSTFYNPFEYCAVVDKADFGPVFGVQVTPDETGMSLHNRKAEIFLVGKSGLHFCEFL